MTVYQAPRPPSSLVPRSYCRFQLLRLKSDEIDRAIMLRMSVSAAPYDGRLSWPRAWCSACPTTGAGRLGAGGDAALAVDAACNDAALAVDAACNATLAWASGHVRRGAGGCALAAICSMWAMALATAGGGRWQSL